MKTNRVTDLEQRRLLIGKLTELADALPGNLVSTQTKSKRKGKEASAAYGPVWLLTWKEAGKTKTLYVRLNEVSRVHEGVEQMRQVKEIIRLIGEINMRLLLADREENTNAGKRKRSRS